MSDTSLGQEEKFTFSASMQEEHRHVSLTPGLWDFTRSMLNQTMAQAIFVPVPSTELKYSHAGPNLG